VDYEATWYEAFGRLVAAAAEFEGNAAYLAVRITDPVDADQVWTPRWEQHLRGRISDTLSTIKKAARTLTRPDDTARVVAWANEGKALMEERNRHVHSITVTGITSQAFTPAPIGRLPPRAAGDGPQTVGTDDLIALDRRIRGHSITAINLATIVDVDRANAR
jgi:uncharacterized protein (DUF427 family)